MLLRTSSIVLGSCALCFLASSCATNRENSRNNNLPDEVVALALEKGPETFENRSEQTLRQAVISSSMHNATESHTLRNEGNLWVSADNASVQAVFDERGVGLWGGIKATPAWEGRITLQSIGRGRNTTLPQATISAKSNRLERGYPGIVEWYTSGPLGLEQGLDISEKPLGEGPLVVELALDQFKAVRTGESAVLYDAQGSARLAVTDLSVRDAQGTLVPSHFEAENGYLRYIIDDKKAHYPIAVDPLFQSFEKQLQLAAVATNTSFGTSVAISGNTAVVGCPSCDGSSALNTGVAYVYVFNNGMWTFQEKLQPAVDQAERRFGNAVAIDGDIVVVGARNESGVNSLSGNAYVFRRSAGVWLSPVSLAPANLIAGAAFGTSVAVSGTTVVVGASGNTGASLTGAGSLYVSTLNGATWSTASKVAASPANAQSNEHLGESVAISGDTIVGGASYADVGGIVDAGAAYVFIRNGSSWSEQAKLTAVVPSAGDRLGYSVGIAGNTAVLGAPFANPGGTADGGVAMVFERIGSNWSEKQTLFASDKIASARFGISVSLSPFLLGVGASAADPAGKTDAGEAYIFAKTGSLWAEKAVLIPSDSATGAFFGGAVGVSSNAMIVGAASQPNGAVSNAGAAYLYRAYWTGEVCLSAADCNTGFCVDGVCCDTACGGDDQSDCQACSTAAGAAVNGVCGVVQASASHTCRAAVNDCDIAEVCDGLATSCPADALVDVGTPCDDGDLCTTGDSCSSGACAGTAITCDPIECYSTPVCNPLTGACESTPDDSLSCSDNDACTSGDHCEGGVCLTTGDVSCDDGNSCTTESCDSLLGCQLADVIDGTPCEVGVCQAGECVTGGAGTAGAAGTAGTGASAGSAGVGGSTGGGGSSSGGSGTGAVGGSLGGSGPGGADAGQSTGGQSAGSGGDSASGGSAANGTSGGSGGTGGTNASLPSNNAAAGDEGSCSMTDSRSNGLLSKLALLSAAVILSRRRRSA